MRWSIKSASPQAHTITFEKVKGGEPIRVLLMSDEHVDNLHCDRKLLSKHHEEAVAIGAPILKFGDTSGAERSPRIPIKPLAELEYSPIESPPVRVRPNPSVVPSLPWNQM